jgi:hypothetical protein
MPKVVQGKKTEVSEKTFKTQAVLSQMSKMEEEEQVASVARNAGLPYIDLNIFPFNADDIRIISEKIPINTIRLSFERKALVFILRSLIQKTKRRLNLSAN